MAFCYYIDLVVEDLNLPVVRQVRSKFIEKFSDIPNVQLKLIAELREKNFVVTRWRVKKRNLALENSDPEWPSDQSEVDQGNEEFYIRTHAFDVWRNGKKKSAEIYTMLNKSNLTRIPSQTVMDFSLDCAMAALENLKERHGNKCFPCQEWRTTSRRMHLARCSDIIFHGWGTTSARADKIFLFQALTDFLTSDEKIELALGNFKTRVDEKNSHVLTKENGEIVHFVLGKGLTAIMNFLRQIICHHNQPCSSQCDNSTSTAENN